MIYIHKTFPHPKFGKAYHLMADTKEELLSAAKEIGLNPAWIQKAGTPYEHFDVMGRFITAAMKNATLINDREAVELIRRKRESSIHGREI